MFANATLLALSNLAQITSNLTLSIALVIQLVKLTVQEFSKLQISVLAVAIAIEVVQNISRLTPIVALVNQHAILNVQTGTN